MSWDPCSFQISGKVCTLQWLKISDIDSSTPEVVSFQQCLTKEQKNARTHFWLDTPRMVLCCDANMFSQALEDQHGQLYIRESLSNIEQLDDWWKGNFVRSGRTSARGVPSFLTGSTMFHGSTPELRLCAPLSPPKSFHGARTSRTWCSLWLNDIECAWTGHFQLQWRSEASWQDRVQSDSTWFAKLGAVSRI